MKQIGLGTFIETVKSEILTYQREHRGEPALFEVEKVELEISLATTIEANGGVKVFVVDIGSSGSQAATHKAMISLKVSPPTQTHSNTKPKESKVTAPKSEPTTEPRYGGGGGGSVGPFGKKLQ